MDKAELTHMPCGILAEFDSADDLYSACERMRGAGFTRWDAHTPFPVHGLSRAMGVRNSRVPWVVLVSALLGAAGAMLLQWWTSAVDYPLVIAGKPLFSWPAFIPVTFEVMVLFGAGAAFVSMLAFNRLPKHNNWVFASSRFERVTNDKFFVSVEAADPKFDEEATLALLGELGATHVEVVRQ